MAARPGLTQADGQKRRRLRRFFEYAPSRTWSPALVAQVQSQLPENKLPATSLHAFHRQHGFEPSGGKPAIS
jgi:hypothetical protein